MDRVHKVSTPKDRVMKEYLKGLFCDDEGAVTVDWVVMTAAVVGLGIGAVSTLFTASNSLGNRVAETISSAEVDDLRNE